MTNNNTNSKHTTIKQISLNNKYKEEDSFKPLQEEEFK